MNRIASWVVLSSGFALFGAAAGIGVIALIGGSINPVRLGGGGIVGAVVALTLVAVGVRTGDVNAEVDRHVGAHRDPEVLDLVDVLRVARVDCVGPVGTGLTDVADTTGVTRGGAR